MLMTVRRIVAWSLMVGGISFAIGFFGPMILAPGANQGPLLGILITGPLGVVLGFVVGVGREALGFRDGPVATFARFGVTGSDVLRMAAVTVGLILVVYGLGGVRRGEGRAAAAALVVGVAAMWYGVAGRLPEWFRR